jgi:peptidoglycan/xylan/chitin deacetylase (PgdA/CDA1 family)
MSPCVFNIANLAILKGVGVGQDRVRFIASRLGMATILWNHDTDDWEIAMKGPAQAQANYVRARQILLFSGTGLNVLHLNRTASSTTRPQVLMTRVA